MPEITFIFDGNTTAMIERLRIHHKLADSAAVLRRALALLEIARQAKEEGGRLVIIDEDEAIHPITL